MEPDPKDVDLIVKVSKGNPGALKVCILLVKMGRRDVVEGFLAEGITGSLVWLAYKDISGEDLLALCENYESNDISDRLEDLGYAPEKGV